jgi:hypothetical protein
MIASRSGFCKNNSFRTKTPELLLKRFWESRAKPQVPVLYSSRAAAAAARDDSSKDERLLLLLLFELLAVLPHDKHLPGNIHSFTGDILTGIFSRIGADEQLDKSWLQSLFCHSTLLFPMNE